MQGHGLLTLIPLGLGTIGRSLGAWGRKRLFSPVDRAVRALRDEDVLSDEDVTGALERSRELEGVPRAALAAIMERSERVVVPTGTVVFHEGDRCSSFYVVISGSAYVLVGHDNPVLVDQMWEGEVFGDLAAFTDECRSASVRAATSLKLLKIERSAILDILQQHPEAAAVLWRNVARDRFDGFLRRLSPRFNMSRAERFAWFLEGRAAEQEESFAEAVLLFVVVGTAEWKSGGRWQAVSAPALISLDQAELHLAEGARAWLLPDREQGSEMLLGLES